MLVAMLAAGADAQSPVARPAKPNAQQTQQEAFGDESEPCPGTRLKTAEVKFGEYTVATYRIPNPWGCFAVERKGQRLHSAVGLVFEIGGTAEFRKWNARDRRHW
jgi:hypothetical protein